MASNWGWVHTVQPDIARLLLPLLGIPQKQDAALLLGELVQIGLLDQRIELRLWQVVELLRAQPLQPGPGTGRRRRLGRKEHLLVLGALRAARRIWGGARWRGGLHHPRSGASRRRG